MSRKDSFMNRLEKEMGAQGCKGLNGDLGGEEAILHSQDEDQHQPGPDGVFSRAGREYRVSKPDSSRERQSKKRIAKAMGKSSFDSSSPKTVLSGESNGFRMAFRMTKEVLFSDSTVPTTLSVHDNPLRQVVMPTEAVQTFVKITNHAKEVFKETNQGFDKQRFNKCMRSRAGSSLKHFF
jgi:hypothetical protein